MTDDRYMLLAVLAVIAFSGAGALVQDRRPARQDRGPGVGRGADQLVPGGAVGEGSGIGEDQRPVGSDMAEETTVLRLADALSELDEKRYEEDRRQSRGAPAAARGRDPADTAAGRSEMGHPVRRLCRCPGADPVPGRRGRPGGLGDVPGGRPGRAGPPDLRVGALDSSAVKEECGRPPAPRAVLGGRGRAPRPPRARPPAGSTWRTRKTWTR